MSTVLDTYSDPPPLHNRIPANTVEKLLYQGSAPCILGIAGPGASKAKDVKVPWPVHLLSYMLLLIT